MYVQGKWKDALLHDLHRKIFLHPFYGWCESKVKTELQRMIKFKYIIYQNSARVSHWNSYRTLETFLNQANYGTFYHGNLFVFPTMQFWNTNTVADGRNIGNWDEGKFNFEVDALLLTTDLFTDNECLFCGRGHLFFVLFSEMAVLLTKL